MLTVFLRYLDKEFKQDIVYGLLATYEVLMVLSTSLSFNTCITLFLSKCLGFGYVSHAELPTEVSFPRQEN